MYGITIMAEEKGELNHKCKTAATRNITSLLNQLIIELCEPHYQQYLVWDKKRSE
jgi:hypothetical protein